MQYILLPALSPHDCVDYREWVQNIDSQYQHSSGLIVVAPLFSVWPENYQPSLDLITLLHT